MKKRLLALFLVLILGGCTSGTVELLTPETVEPPTPVQWTPAAPQPEEFHPFALAYDSKGSWNPYTGASSANFPLLGLIGEGLYELDGSFSPVPVLAASATESENGLTWRVKLRQEVTFSDGEPLDAAAVVKLVNAAQGEGSVYQSRLREVENVTAAGAYTVEFTLSKPNRSFPALLDFPLVRTVKKQPIGTGAYVLEKDEEGRRILAPNLTWWRGEPVPAAEIALVKAGDTQSLMTALDEGRVTLTATDLSEPEGLSPAGECKSQDYPTSTMLYLGFRRDSGLCKDARFCRALCRGLDRGALVNETLGGHAAVATLPVPPASPRYDRALGESLGYDPAAAGEALDELGYLQKEDGLRYQKKTPLTLTLAANGSSSLHREIAARLRRDLTALGLTVKVKLMPWKEYTKALENKNFDLYLGECRLTADGDLTPFFTKGSGLCFTPGAAETLRDKAEAAKASGDWSGFFETFVQEPLFAPLCFKNGSVLIQRDRVTGATPTQGNLFYGFERWRVQ